MQKNKLRNITSNDLYLFNIITSQELSPDGKHIVFSVQHVDRNSEKKTNNLWIAPTNGEKLYQFTFGNQSDIQPKWSPDGKKIAFISNRIDENQFQIFTIPFEGGEARTLTNMKGEFNNFAYSPDGKKIVACFRKKDQDAIERELDAKKKDLGIVYRHIDRVFYKLDGYGYLPKERWHLWIINTKTGHSKQITDSKIHDHLNPQWSSDNKRIVYQANISDNPDLVQDADDLFILDIVSKQETKVTTPSGSKSLPAFSPDGKTIAYFGQEGKNVDWKNNLLWIVPSDSSKPARALTKQFDITAIGTTINDIGSQVIKPPSWDLEGNIIYFQVIKHGNTSLFSLNLIEEAIEEVINNQGVVGDFNFDKSHERIGYLFATMQDPGQIFIKDVNNKSGRQLTNLNQDWLSKIDLGSIEEFWFKGSDENDLQAWVIKPPNFDPTQKYPSILEIHGGPMVQYGNIFMHEFYFLAAKGYVVYFTNPRGGRGYGEEHTKAIHGGKWGTVDYEDLMKLSDLMETKPYIDKTRMGVTGGSYGGYMTAWIIGHTTRYNAAVAQRVVSNLLSMWGSSDYNWSFQTIFGNKAPYEDIKTLWQCSPMRHLGSAKTPTLVIHSQDDLRCPIEQGEQLYIGLKNLGVPSEFLVFPDSPHGVSRVGRTDRRIVRLEGMKDWFERYLK
ncbi:MAG: S9 family peptidase [Anaerolineaceae bacterium]|nr:S9 family peptidase [Anaerolineaceae bacterium]